MTSDEAPWRVRHYETIGSTQAACCDAARSGEPGRLAILAETQVEGRGRSGRRWIAPRGNLNLSILLRPSGPPDPGRWALHAGVALHETLTRYTDGLLLKWPNDVLLHGNKIGGVLIDCALDTAGELEWVVVGVGANLLEAPQLEGRVAACVPQPGPSAAVVAKAFLESWDRWAGCDLRSAWLDRAHQAGTPLDVVMQHRRIRGRFAGLSPSGELLLEGVAAPIASAEVFLPPAIVPSEIAPCSSS